MKKIAGALLNYFVKGLIIVIPIGAAAFLIFWGAIATSGAITALLQPR